MLDGCSELCDLKYECFNTVWYLRSLREVFEYLSVSVVVYTEFVYNLSIYLFYFGERIERVTIKKNKK